MTDKIDKLIIENTPIGPLIITADNKSIQNIKGVRGEISKELKEEIKNKKPIENIDNVILKQFNQEIELYFKGELKQFKTPYNEDTGTVFQRKVWNQIKLIPYGTTTSYTKIAEQLGYNKSYSRAIASCCRLNLFFILIPVHRVVAITGKSIGKSCKLGINKQTVLQSIETNGLKK